jgi:hypothetical protein
MPYAYVTGHDAGRAGAADADNPYAQCLPTDSEPLAALWDEGLRLGRRASLGVDTPAGHRGRLTSIPIPIPEMYCPC